MGRNDRNDKKEYAERNRRYLEAVALEEGVRPLGDGILYRVLESGEGKSPAPNDVVSVYYKGSLIDGRVFDDNTDQGYPDAFRLRDLIPGWVAALTHMREGDRWQVFVPAAQGYGKRGDADIPGNSTLVFEIKLMKVN